LLVCIYLYTFGWQGGGGGARRDSDGQANPVGVDGVRITSQCEDVSFESLKFEMEKEKGKDRIRFLIASLVIEAAAGR